ncbi:MAG: DUF2142 domain-containing protein [Planctomycetes bacterium]|nr:DUF2142 domain-containing protein [Planctomycetota bacterium]
MLVALFLCRGLLVLCVLPPFEGWDEYQHVAYVDHMARVHTTPDPRSTRVSQEFLSVLPAFPQSARAVEQLGQFGVRTYQQWWATRDVGHDRLDAGPIILYEAQHGPLYYRLAAPIYSAFGGVRDLRRSVGMLRLLNLILATVALWVVLRVLERLCKDPVHAAMMGTVLALHPMFLLVATRVANDALAVLFATIVVAMILCPNDRRLVVNSGLVGIVAGLAVAAKAVNLALLPFAVVCTILPAIHRRIGVTRAVLSASLLIGGALMVASVPLVGDVSRSALAPPVVEGLMNRDAGRGADALVSAGIRMDWMVRRLVGGSASRGWFGVSWVVRRLVGGSASRGWFGVSWVRGPNFS